MNTYHTFPIRIYTEDTDCYSIVYYANYLKFAERGRTEALRDIGGDLITLQNNGMRLVVRSCLLNCLASARLNDVLEVRTHFKKPGRARLEVSQTIVCEDRIIATLEVLLASINPLGKPIRIDTVFANKLWTHFGEI
jgi:acyl-CoA thioester hydrolase